MLAPRAMGALLAACGLLVLASSVGALNPNQETDWTRYLSQTGGLTLGGVSLSEELRNVLSHQFSTPLEQIQASNVYTAGNARFRRVVNELATNKPIKVVAIGGVATNGSDATTPGRNDYFALFVNYLARAYPGAKIDAVRSSVGVAPSAVLGQCLGNFLPDDADLVLLEMTANDGVFMDNSMIVSQNGKAYELVMRKILQSSKKPALVLTQSMVPGMGNGRRPFYLTPEAPQYAALTSYYATPYLSMRNALWGSGLSVNGQSLITSTAVSQKDGSTPLDAGHRSINDMLVYLTQRTAQDLVLLPYGDYDRTSISRDMPEAAVYADVVSNPGVVLSNSTCFWIRNISSDSRRCPTRNWAQMCGFDYSSKDTFLASYDANADLGSDDAGSSRLAILVGAIVGGVLGGLLLIGGLLACCIIKQKRHQAMIAQQVEAKLAARKASASGNPPSTVPITASSNA